MIRVPPTGPRSAPLAFIGEAPAEQEEKDLIPLVGRTGKLFNQILLSSGIPREEIYISNFSKYRLKDDKISTLYRSLNRESYFASKVKGNLVIAIPKSWDTDDCNYFGLTDQGMDCMRELREELKGLAAKVIIPMGNPATMAVCGVTEISKIRGAHREVDYLPGKFILPTYHPASALRGSYMNRHYIRMDFCKARRMAEPDFQVPKVNHVIQPSFPAILAGLAKCWEIRRFGLDIECPKKNPSILAIGFSWSPWEGMSIPMMDHCYPGEQHLIRQAIIELLEDPGVTAVTQNGIYDSYMLEHLWGFRFKAQLDDSMVFHRIQWPDMESGLDVLASLYTYRPYWKGDGKESKRVGDLKQFLIYNSNDSTATLEIGDKLLESPLMTQGDRIAYHQTMAIHPVLRQMMHSGFRVDKEEWKRMEIEHKAKLKRLQAELDEMARPVFEEQAAPLRAKLAYAQAEVLRLGEKRNKISTKTGKPLKSMEFVFPVEERRKAGKLVTKLKKEIKVWEPIYNEKLGTEVLLNTSSNSGPDSTMVWYFYTRLGIPPYKGKTGKGENKKEKITLDETALQRLSRPTSTRKAIPEAAKALEVREERKFIETYINMDVDPDGRWRCQYKPKGTKTGRLSSAETYWQTGTNHLNVPSEFRSVAIADPGTFWGAIDKKGAEWVVTAYASGDKRMIEVVEAKMNPHLHTAHLMTGISKDAILAEYGITGTSTSSSAIATARRRLILEGYDEFDKAKWLPSNMSLYQMGKKADHSLNYMEGYAKFSLVNQLAETEGKRIHYLYTQEAYPGLPVWWKEVEEELKTKRMLTNCFGRTYRTKHPIKDVLVDFVAFVPQSTIADAVLQGLLELQDKLPRMEAKCEKYDEIIYAYEFANKEHHWQDLQRLLAAMSPEMEYKGRRFRVGDELQLGLGWGKLQGCEIEEEAVTQRIEELEHAA